MRRLRDLLHSYRTTMIKFQIQYSRWICQKTCKIKQLGKKNLSYSTKKQQNSLILPFLELRCGKRKFTLLSKCNQMMGDYQIPVFIININNHKPNTMKCLLLLVLLIVVNGQSENSYEKLYVKDNIVTFQFLLANKHLPFPLRQSLHQKLGKYLFPFLLSFGSKWKNHYGYPNNGIKASIRTLSFSDISQKEREVMQNTLFDIFSISKQTKNFYTRNTRSMHKWEEFHDPNDKFCVHHIEEIIRNFLPCRDNSGIAQLIKSQAFFQSGYVGMSIQWQREFLKVQIFVQIQKEKPLMNLKKIKILQRCKHFKEIIMTDQSQQNITLKEVVVNRILQSNVITKNKEEKDTFQRPIIYKRVIGNWYSPYKTLLLEIQVNLTAEFRITIPQVLPQGCEIISRKVYYLENNQEKIVSKDLSFNATSSEYFFVQTKFIAKMKNFDIYESIYGGGEEVPTFHILFNRTDQYEERYFQPPTTTIKVPQPDFSIPFHVMTFTVAAIGYLWLAIWRAYFTYCE